ncbi:hypothetical protein ACQEVM_38275 [Streptomyces sp. CA-243310]|uniref:hypothetical protein n=1 Tax=Streptomyces sp. CA-243310 TaxID=3240056 RepID=UPI003D8D1499
MSSLQTSPETTAQGNGEEASHVVEVVGIDDFMLTYSSEHSSDPAFDDGVQHWDVGMHFKDDGGPSESFGSIRIVIADQDRCLNIVDALDNLSSDLCAIGTALYRPDGDLRQDLHDRLALAGKTAIVDRVTIDRRFRGQGLGVYLTGLALDYLSHGSGLIALFPGPLERDASFDYATACSSLGRAWSRIGFEPYRDGTWILDPGLRTLTSCLNQEWDRLQQHRWSITFREDPTSYTGSVVTGITMCKTSPFPLARQHTASPAR